ncbi:hypothetical protein KKD62_02735 [Patescibacteria group bacterium]|nr:hypothetical protein [Patescibacteria group bacterium]MBU1931856.1 hypothetical protein [Patescibacteria group bacterium]
MERFKDHLQRFLDSDPTGTPNMEVFQLLFLCGTCTDDVLEILVGDDSAPGLSTRVALPLQVFGLTARNKYTDLFLPVSLIEVFAAPISA